MKFLKRVLSGFIYGVIGVQVFCVLCALILLLPALTHFDALAVVWVNWLGGNPHTLPVVAAAGAALAFVLGFLLSPRLDSAFQSQNGRTKKIAQAVLIVVAVPLILFWYLSGQPGTSSNRISKQPAASVGIEMNQGVSAKDVPPEYAETTVWLESLRRPPETLHGPKGTPKWNVDLLVNTVSESGLLITDVNEEKNPTILSRAEVESELRGRKERLSRIIGHVGTMYNQPGPQHSKLSFKGGSNSVELQMGDVYRFKYAFEHGHYKLREIHYLVREGE